MADFIGRNGIRQPELATLLALMNTKFTATLALLDDDAGVAATDYESGSALTFPSTDISGNGIRDQGVVLTFLNSLIAALAVVTGKLDADALTDSDYASTIDITDNITADGSDGEMSPMGVDQGRLIVLIDLFITNFNLLNAKLVADATVQTGTYASANDITDTVDSTS